MAETSQRFELDLSDPALLFVTFGGFIYTDAAGRVVQTAAIGGGADLYFDPPQRWRDKFTSSLSKVPNPPTPLKARPVAVAISFVASSKLLCAGSTAPRGMRGSTALVRHRRVASRASPSTPWPRRGRGNVAQGRALRGAAFHRSMRTLGGGGGEG